MKKIVGILSCTIVLGLCRVSFAGMTQEQLDKCTDLMYTCSNCNLNGNIVEARRYCNGLSALTHKQIEFLYTPAGERFEKIHPYWYRNPSSVPSVPKK